MNRDQRWARLAQVLADGTAVTAGDRVSVFLTDAGCVEAAEAVVTEVLRRGGLPQVLLTDERFDRAALATASTAQLSWVPELEAEALRWSDVHLSLRGMLPPAPPPAPADDRVAAQRRAKGVISTLRWEETRWAIVRVPTAAWAAFAGIDQERLSDEFFAGCLMDWPARRAGWAALADRLSTARRVRIRSDDTDLTLETAERSWVVFGGEANLPDGEIATAPHEHGVSGFIAFPGRFVFAGAAFEDLRLEIADGRVTEVEAARGAGLARALVATDEGAARIGELGIGLNPEMTTMTGDLFFDEKILGTVHIALGRAYPQCGGTNHSALHWDIVKDLRGPADGSLVIDEQAYVDRGVVTDALGASGP